MKYIITILIILCLILTAITTIQLMIIYAQEEFNQALVETNEELHRTMKNLENELQNGRENNKQLFIDN